MAQAMLNKSDVGSEKKEAVVIKKYANRRLYNTETSTYVTLDDLAQMVRKDKDFVVYDAKSGDDLTHAVLTQIIVEQESREGGQTLLPIPFDDHGQMEVDFLCEEARLAIEIDGVGSLTNPVVAG